MAGISDPSGNPADTYRYDSAGRLTLDAKGNGTSTRYTYDAAGNLTHIVNYGVGGAIVLSRAADAIEGSGSQGRPKPAYAIACVKGRSEGAARRRR